MSNAERRDRARASRALGLLRVLGGVAPMVTSSLVVILGVMVWAFTVDDAWIVARYARRIVEGRGYTMNDGPPTDGVTAPLWLALSAGGIALGAPPMWTQKVLGVVAAAAAVWIVARATTRSYGVLAGTMGAVFLAASSQLVIWSVAGLETGLATLAFAIVSAAYLREAPRVMDLALACVPWLRPELVPATALLALGGAITFSREGGRARALPVVSVLSCVGVLAFRQGLFGSPLPLAFFAKPSDLGFGAEYVARTGLVLLGLGVVPAIIACRRSRRARWIGAACAVHLVSVLFAGGDWMPGARLIVPILPGLAVLVGVGMVRLRRERGMRVALLAAAAALVLPILDGVAQIPEVRASDRGQDLASEIAGDLRRAGVRVLGLVDVGRIPFESGVEVVDLGGLTDPRIARLPGGHLDKAIDASILDGRGVDALLLHSRLPPRVDGAGRLTHLMGFPVERRVASLPWTRASFAVAGSYEYSAEYHYVLLLRRASMEQGSLR